MPQFKLDRNIFHPKKILSAVLKECTDPVLFSCIGFSYLVLFRYYVYNAQNLLEVPYVDDVSVPTAYVRYKVKIFLY